MLAHLNSNTSLQCSTAMVLGETMVMLWSMHHISIPICQSCRWPCFASTWRTHSPLPAPRSQTATAIDMYWKLRQLFNQDDSNHWPEAWLGSMTLNGDLFFLHQPPSPSITISFI